MAEKIGSILIPFNTGNDYRQIGDRIDVCIHSSYVDAQYIADRLCGARHGIPLIPCGWLDMYAGTSIVKLYTGGNLVDIIETPRVRARLFLDYIDDAYNGKTVLLVADSRVITEIRKLLFPQTK